MKKILSLLLVLSLCLSSVILLASCGKSAYDIAVEGGFVGTEEEWLASLKGADGKDGKKGKDGQDGEDGDPGLPGLNGEDYVTKVPTGTDGKDGITPEITVNADGFWVINGVVTTQKVDGTFIEVTDLELVSTHVTVAKHGFKPEVKVKYTLETGESRTITASDLMLSGNFDLTKEGKYKITVTYSGKSEEFDIVVDGIMIYYETYDMDNTEYTDMEELFIKLGYKLPTYDPAVNTRTDVPDALKGGVNPLTGISPNSPVVLKGYFPVPNLLKAKIVDGRLYCMNAKQEFEGEPGWFAGFQILPAGYLAGIMETNDDGDKLYTYTVQYDMQISPYEYVAYADGETKIHMTTDGIALTLHSSVNPNKSGADAGTPWGFRPRQFAYVGQGYGITHDYLYTDMKGTPMQIQGGFAVTNEQLINKLFPEGKSDGETLGADSAFADFIGVESNEGKKFEDLAVNRVWDRITVRLVVTPEGYDIYMKSAQVDEFVLMSETNWTSDTPGTQAKYTEIMNAGDAVVMHLIYTSAAYIDNFAIWSGTGDMPVDTDTTAYEEILASLN